MEYPVVRIERSDVQIFDVVDDVVGRSVAAGDPLIAMEYIQGLQRDGFVKGLAIAKMLYRIKQSWDLFRTAGTDDDFENVVETTTGYKASTVHKYINMWESVFENPSIADELKMLLAGKPMETLLLLTAAAREGSLTDEDWTAVAHASDIKDVRAKVRERRGTQTSASSAKIPSLYYREMSGKMPGTLAITVNGETKIVGLLYIDNPDEDVQQYIARMVNELHIYEVR